MALHIFLSNSLETLASKFAEKLSMTDRDVFEALHAVVPNGGMGMFLKRFLAQQSEPKIAANIETPFLQKFITDQICRFFDEDKRREFRNSLNLWSPDVLSWRIDRTLARTPGAFSKEFSDYFADDPVKRHLLACEIAGNFDRYQLYRSSAAGHTFLNDWRTGKIESPQGELYRKLCEESPDPDSFFSEFFNVPAPTGVLPARAGIFGISSMAPLYFHCLKKLASHMELYLFCPSPCQVYWGDLLSRRELLKEKPEHFASLLEERAGNNQILADFGVTGRSFFNLLLETDCFSSGTGPEELYIDPAPEEKGSVLQIFQSDILNARARNAYNNNAIQADPEDRSIRINCCTDPRRELEILHDQLLELFYGTDKECRGKKAVRVSDALKLEDVIVMFPDINKAAPMIDAVFSNGPFKGRYAICDRSSAGQSPVINCFSRLLDLPYSRASSEDILELLEFECLSSRLGIATEKIPDLADLIARARINWGLDEQEHEMFRMTSFKEFSWQDGIDRLLVEYARGEEASVIYSPDDTGGIDGDLAENFGIVAEFIGLLKEWRSQLHISRTPKEWSEFMQKWIGNFFTGSSKEYAPEISELRRAAAKVAGNAATAFDEDETLLIPSEVFISRLKSEYAVSGGKQHFLRDKITFCSLVPLRAVPAKVIAVLGLNDGEFPGVERHNSFDLLSQIHRNDPNLTNDGRYLFLEALMAARENLILSHIGVDNGEELAPAIPLGAVENVLAAGFGVKKQKIRLKSLELDFLNELRSALHGKDQSGEDSNSENQYPESPIPSSMSLKDLADLLTANCKIFCKLRCGFEYQKFEKAPPGTDDPESVNPMDESAIQRALWAMELAGIPEEKWKDMVIRRRFLPYNDDECYEGSKGIIKSLSEKFSDDFRCQRALDCELKLPCGVTLSGTLPVCGTSDREPELIVVHFSKFSQEKLFRFHLEQLLLSACNGQGNCPEGKIVFSKDGSIYNVPPYADAAEKLNVLMEIALCTYTNQTPLPLFTNASTEYAKNSDAWKKIKSAFEEDIKYNAVISRFFDETILADNKFQELATAVFGDIAKLKSGEL